MITAAFLNIGGIWFELDKSICHHLYSPSFIFYLFLVRICLSSSTFLCWVNKIHQDYLPICLNIFVSSRLFSRRRLSAVITAVFCEGKVLRIDNEEDAFKFFIYTHDSACVYTMILIHIKLIIHFWFIRERLCMSRYIYFD
jgi:hypothetical protein